MKPTTLEWIHKAEEDWHVAQMSYRARKYPSYDATVFHAQQCAEKYLKARLEEAAIGFARTHDLLMLHQSDVLTQSQELDTVWSKFELTKV